MKLVAFLRGINVGGKHQIKMSDLKRVFESVGMTDVKTVLASGNVIFDSTLRPEAAESKLATAIEQEFKFPVPVAVRSCDELIALVEVNPFRKIRIGDQTRLYVSFLPTKPKTQTSTFTPPKFVTVVLASEKLICMALELSKETGTTDLMSLLDKQFGKTVTTRNWETVKKCIAA